MPTTDRTATVPDEPTSIVIVGAGIAGTRAASTLRREGFAGRVTLVNGETHPPYDHVPLSKQYLLDEPGFHPLHLRDTDWYLSDGIDLRTRVRATSIDVAARTVELDDTGTLHWDRLLLATGAAPRRLDVPGADLDGVHHLRTIDDAQALAAALRDACHVAVIGDGFIGCEVAASARTLGRDVTVIGRGPLPMHRALGPMLGRWFRDVHLAHGVRFHHDASVTALTGSGRVETVGLADGTEVPADLVVVGIGAIPRTGLAEAAGIRVDGGVVTDEHLATDTPGVWAAGDIAAVFDPTTGRHVRREHWATALHQGPTAARNMLGQRVVWDRTPFFFTDQYDVWMEHTGSADPDDDVVVRGDPDGGEDARFIVFRTREGRITAVTNVNVREVPPLARALIRSGRTVDPTRLTDPDVPLDRL